MAEEKKSSQKNSYNVEMEVTYWKSFKQLHKNPEFLEASRHEFTNEVTDGFDPSKLSGISRRKFFALVSASAALAAAGCSDYRDKGEIIPYIKKPQEIIPGKANYYASFVNHCKCGCGILIKTREGRPIKIDGNPDHPVSQGKICAKCQASIMSLYDPERLASPFKKLKKGDFEKITWARVDSEIRNVLQHLNGKEIAIITHTINSPTTLKVLQDFISKYHNTKVYSYELYEQQIRDTAWNKCYITTKFPLIKWDKANIILSLEGDFLGTEGNYIENSRMFVSRRDINSADKFNKLYVIEGNMSLTGMNADYRLRLRPDAQFEFVMSLVNEIAKKINSSTFGDYSLSSFVKEYSLSKEVLGNLVNDLINNRGSSIIYAGNILSEKVHIAVNYLNEILGNKSLYRDETDISLHPYTKNNDWKNLVSSMNNGRIGAVIHFDSNPVYHLPNDLGYKEALKKVDTVISLVELENETSVLGNYVLPINHSLECWGDAKTRTGYYSLQQPVISPIHDTRQKEAILLTWIYDSSLEYEENLYHTYLKRNWQENIYSSISTKLQFNEFWLGALHDGVVIISESTPLIGSFNTPILSELYSGTRPSGLAVALKESYSMGDGRYANNGWLQELPHPISKVTWDNYAALSHTLAKKLRVDNNDYIEIVIDNRKLKIPVFIQPGSADDTITIELGYGRTVTGTIGKETGFNANVLLSSAFSYSPFLYTGADAKKAGGSYEIVSAQEHHSFDDKLTKDVAKRRGIFREGTIEEFLSNPHFLKGEEHDLTSLYHDYNYTGVKWGMAIDQNKCIGCGECVIACTAENNIPVVGKDQVNRGREMHWIRIDRYYSGSPDEPSVSNQVMLCQHCDNAPCENVCPVVATTHSPDGLNQMVYNRCVGTRYCSNNCPYKVRRFNFYNFRDHYNDGYQLDNLFNLIYNPEVTVRSRGVMEKCSFCIQRIAEARENAIRENRQLKGTDVKTACQEACPTNAIVFGDINDKEAELSKKRNHQLGYFVLEELNVRPNVTYIAKLRNRNKEEV